MSLSFVTAFFSFSCLDIHTAPLFESLGG